MLSPYFVFPVCNVYRIFHGGRCGFAIPFKSTVPLEIQSDLNLAYPSADRNRVTAEVVLSESIKAPVEQGAILGELLVSLEDEELARLPVYAAEPVSKLGIVGQAMEGLSAMIVPPASAGASALVLPE